MSNQRLSKNTVLALLPSKLDTAQLIEVATGEVFAATELSEATIISHLKDKSWVYYETAQPRRMLLTNPDWQVASFDSSTRNVCIRMSNQSGICVLNLTLSALN